MVVEATFSVEQAALVPVIKIVQELQTLGVMNPFQGAYFYNKNSIYLKFELEFISFSSI